MLIHLLAFDHTYRITPSVDFKVMALLGEVVGLEYQSAARHVGIPLQHLLQVCLQRIRVVNVAFYIPLLFVNILRLSIQGMGFTRVAMLAGLSEMIARSAIALFVVPAAGFTGACFASPAAWVLADLFLFPCYFQIMRTLRQRLLPDTEEFRKDSGIIRLRRAA